MAGACALAAGAVSGPLLPGPLSIASAHAEPPVDTAAIALIETYQAALLDAMQRADALGIQGRAEVLDGPVRATFNFARMARAAAGKAWRAASEQDRADMVQAFGTYSVAVHANRFDGFGGERFVIDGAAPGSAETVLVHTHIDRPGKDAVAISYVVAQGPDGPGGAQGPDGPKVVDVLLKGSISEVALRRSEWAAIGEREGLPGLVTALNALAGRMLKDS